MLYVSRLYDNLIAPFSVDGTGQIERSLAAATTGAQPVHITFTTDGRVVYVANYAGSSLSAFSRDATAGLLAPVGTYSTQSNPVATALDRTGSQLFVAHLGSPSIGRFAVNQTTGTLSALPDLGTPAPALALVVAASTDRLYASFADSKIRVYRVTPGAIPQQSDLTLLQTADAETEPRHLQLVANGRYLLVVNASSDTLNSYEVSSADGTLTFKDSAKIGDDLLAQASIGSFSGSSRPVASVATADGRRVYVLNTSWKAISAYSLDVSTGALASIRIPSGKSLPTTQLSPASLALNAADDRLYVTNTESNTLSVYSIDAVTGWPELFGSPTPTGEAPYFVTVR